MCLDNIIYTLAKFNYYFHRYFVDDLEFSTQISMWFSYRESFTYIFPKCIPFILALLHWQGSPIMITKLSMKTIYPCLVLSLWGRGFNTPLFNMMLAVSYKCPLLNWGCSLASLVCWKFLSQKSFAQRFSPFINMAVWFFSLVNYTDWFSSIENNLADSWKMERT